MKTIHVTHQPIERMEDELLEAITRTLGRGGKVIIPSFALERAQEVIYALKRLKAKGHLANVPVYVDSPLTARLTEVFRLHPDCFDREAQGLLLGGDSPFDFDGLRYISAVEDLPGLASSGAILYPAAPNPFNPRTEISFRLTEPGRISLEIHDLAGRLVRTLISQQDLGMGLHHAEWDGRTDDGRVLASGVYFYRIEAGSFSDSKKMVLLR